MFRKLQKRLTMLIMTVISVLMVIVFVVIYALTCLDIQSENQAELKNAAEALGILAPDSFGSKIKSENPANTFAVTVNSQGQITDIQTAIKMEEDIYEQAAEAVLASEKKNSKIKLDQKLWIFRIDDKSNIYFGGDGASKNTIWFDTSNVITFLDVTESQRILTRLGITLGIVTFIMLFIIYAVSSMFARHSVAPIELAYTKQKQFIADASHELKTPIASISANADVLLANRQDRIEDQEKWLTYIKAETERMNKLVKNLLYLAKSDAADVSHNSLPFNISDTVSEAVLSMEAVLFEKGLDFSSEIEPGLIVSGESDKVAQVVTILLDNAAKYTPAGGSIEVNLRQNRHHAVFSVCNTADGISKEDLPKLFDRFYRSDPSRKYNGSYGLGLSIAKSIMEHMGGKIYASCEEGKSITFVFELNKYISSNNILQNKNEI